MLTCDQFHVNQTWIAFQVNKAFFVVQDEPYDVYVLIDAASTYVLGHVFSRVADEAPDPEKVENLFRQAWAVKRQWAKQLIITKQGPAEEVFRIKAEINGLSVKTVPEADLKPIIGPLKKSFNSNFRR